VGFPVQRPFFDGEGRFASAIVNRASNVWFVEAYFEEIHKNNSDDGSCKWLKKNNLASNGDVYCSASKSRLTDDQFF
jgi:hypothetical protein